MDMDTPGFSAIAERRAFRRNQLGIVISRLEAFQHQEGLVLAAAPLRVQVNEENIHELAAPVPRPLEAISLPSLAYFNRTERAAMCAMRTPR